ncbi:hypothetical protein FACS189487_03440 [Campylobacterota bacterium]|nr:hypothetical protein FACS189487_03440 [Campylobacterota bacterium]
MSAIWLLPTGIASGRFQDPPSNGAYPTDRAYPKQIVSSLDRMGYKGLVLPAGSFVIVSEKSAAKEKTQPQNCCRFNHKLEKAA